MIEIALYLLVGIAAGTLSGLFGIGGGIIVVPALALIFPHIGMPTSEYMHMAVGTSLAVMIVTTTSSVIAHLREGQISWRFIKLFLPVATLGILAGALLAHYMPAKELKGIFGIFLFFYSIKLLFFSHQAAGIEPAVRYPKKRFIALVSGLIGFLSALLGIGAGTLAVPFLTYCRENMRVAIATSAVCSLIVGILGTAGFVVTGWNGKAHQHILWASGYVYWTAFIMVAVMSLCFAPVGAKLVHRLPVTVLKKAFAVLLLVVAITMLIGDI